MPEWSDNAIIIGSVKFAERDAIISFLTQTHGKCRALCKGVFSKRTAGTFQIGNLVQLTWKARLEEHLGTAKVELLNAYSAPVLSDPKRLTALSCLCAMSALLPERENVEKFFRDTLEQIALLSFDGWETRYCRWETELLKVLGFGLDLTECVVTGTKENLIYVSPKSGRAVCKTAGEQWKDKLLSLPAFLRDQNLEPKSNEEIKKAVNLTGFFLENYVVKTLDCTIPDVRKRLVGYWSES